MAVTANVTDVPPAGIVAEAGTVATDVLLEESEKITPEPMRYLMMAILPKRMIDKIIAKRLGLMPSA